MKSSIPVDLFNPGQVFACLGFMEAAEVLLGDVEGGFDWSEEADVRFVLSAAGNENPFVAVLGFIATANVSSLAPANSVHETEGWQVPTERLPQDESFPFPDPDSPATLPALLEGSWPVGSARTIRLTIDHWGDETRRDTVKFWGGAGGYPGSALARNAIDLVRERCRDAALNPFALSAEQSSSFRFDWRRDYIPIDIGFSLNSHSRGRIAAVGFPLVELFAALGLCNARPTKLHILDYRYGVIGAGGPGAAPRVDSLFDPNYVRAALGGSLLPFPQRTFRMRLGWPAKEGQARAITTVTEESTRWQIQ